MKTNITYWLKRIIFLVLILVQVGNVYGAPEVLAGTEIASVESAQGGDIVNSWRVLDEVGETGLAGRLDDIELVNTHLKNNPNKTPNNLVDEINEAGGFNTWKITNAGGGWTSLIGRNINTIDNAPTGYRFFTYKGQKRLKRVNAQDDNYPRLTLDADNNIIRYTGPNRLSNPYWARKNLEAALGRNIPENHQIHHMISDNVARDHPFFQRARELGFDLDEAANLRALAEPDITKVPGVSDLYPSHRGPHDNWDANVRVRADQYEANFNKPLKDIKPDEMSTAIRAIQDQLEIDLKKNNRKNRLMNCFIIRAHSVSNEDIDFDANAISQNNVRIGPQFMKLMDQNCPVEILYQVNPKITELNDFPFTDATVLVISSKARKIIDSATIFNNFQWVPARMMKADKKDVPHTYYAPIFKEYTDVFDFDKSIYKEDTLFGNRVGVIEEMILKEPKKGFPGIFKIDEAIGFTFINEEVKKALEKANVKGCSFEEVKVTPFHEESA